MENRRNLLVTLADKNYIPQVKQLFSSVYWNAGWEGDYMLLSHEIPEEDLKWFRDKGILIRECSPLHDGSVKYVFSPVVLDKFYLFTEEFKKWKNIVFLDSDIIVKASLERLTKIKYFGAVRDLYYNRLATQFYNPQKNQFNNITYNFNVPAFNSGVFSFRTDLITPDTFSELDILFKDHFSEFRFLDQATLNLYFYKKWKKLPLIYNLFMIFLNYKIPYKLKYILIHFITCPDLCPLWDPKNPFYQEWKTNLERAEFIDINKIQKVKKWDILKIEYYNSLLNIYFFKLFAPHKLRSFFVYKLRSFFVYRLKSFFLYLLNSPGRLIGKIGNFIKKINPGLYHKLRKMKGGK